VTVMHVEVTASCDVCGADATWLAERTPISVLAGAYGSNFTELQPITHTYRITCDQGGGPCHVAPSN